MDDIVADLRLSRRAIELMTVDQEGRVTFNDADLADKMRALQAQLTQRGLQAQEGEFERRFIFDCNCACVGRG